MFSDKHHQKYQEFSQLLEKLQKNGVQNFLGRFSENFYFSSSGNEKTSEKIDKPDKATLSQGIEEIQEFFSKQIVTLDNTELDPVWESRVQSYITEIHKQLRLLAMDATFLQASRNSQTTQERLQTISDRLNTIIGYCSTLLGKNEPR